MKFYVMTKGPSLVIIFTNLINFLFLMTGKKHFGQKDLIYLNAINKIHGAGSQKIKMLLDFFGSTENIWKANSSELKKSGIREALAEKISAARTKINPEEEWQKLEKNNIHMISFEDSEYPRLLKEIPNPPFILYLKTNISSFDLNSAPMLSVVGSRKFTQYGKQTAERLSHDMAAAGLTIVSGMAIGIDAFAHRGALTAGGRTIAVLGSSLEDKFIGPKNNYNLSREIMNSGALVSDFPLETPSLPGNFPARNRIMAGLSLGTLVIEAALESGTLITANLALDFNREVFAVPGSIYSSQSAGAHELIKSGAKIASSAKDILEELRIEQRLTNEKIKKIIPDSREEEVILKILSSDPLHIDTITKMTKLESSIASATLVVMEMKGKVKNIGGQNYISVNF